MRDSVALITTIPVVALAGCVDGDGWVVLAGDNVELIYECEAWEPLAGSDEEKELLRQQAIRIIQHANDRADMESIEPLMTAYGEEDDGALEELVVRRLCDHPEEMYREPHFPDPESEAPSLDLPVVAAPPEVTFPEGFRLSDFRGQYVLVDFWSTWCPPCVQKYPEFLEVVDRYQGRGFTAVGVLHHDRPDRAVRWLEENGGVRYPWVDDARSLAARSWGVRGIPRMFLIDPDGRVVESCTGCQWGPMSVENLPALLDELMGL